MTLSFLALMAGKVLSLFLDWARIELIRMRLLPVMIWPIVRLDCDQRKVLEMTLCTSMSIVLLRWFLPWRTDVSTGVHIE